jgi:hypothetical protein
MRFSLCADAECSPEAVISVLEGESEQSAPNEAGSEFSSWCCLRRASAWVGTFVKEASVGSEEHSSLAVRLQPREQSRPPAPIAARGGSRSPPVVQECRRAEGEVLRLRLVRGSRAVVVYCGQPLPGTRSASLLCELSSEDTRRLSFRPVLCEDEEGLDEGRQVAAYLTHSGDYPPKLSLTSQFPATDPPTRSTRAPSSALPSPSLKTSPSTRPR